jgi:hypothetical protein
MIETRRASRIRPLGLALSSWRADTSSEGWEVLSRWQPSASVTTPLMSAPSHRTPVGSTLETVGFDGWPSADRRPARRGALPAPSLSAAPRAPPRRCCTVPSLTSSRSGHPSRRRCSPATRAAPSKQNETAAATAGPASIIRGCGPISPPTPWHDRHAAGRWSPGTIGGHNPVET